MLSTSIPYCARCWSSQLNARTTFAAVPLPLASSTRSETIMASGATPLSVPFAAIAPAMNVPCPPGSSSVLPSWTKSTRASTLPRRSGWSATPVSMIATVAPLPRVKNHAKGARLDVSGSENCDASSSFRSKPDLPDLPSPDAVTVTSRVATVTLGSVASEASASVERRAMTVSAAASVSTSTEPRRVRFMESAPAWPLVV